MRVLDDASLYTDAKLQGRGCGYYCQAFCEDGKMYIMKWFDNKPVMGLLCSSIHGGKPTDVSQRWCKTEQAYISVSRTNVIKRYNEAMGGVDLIERVISYNRIIARMKKWS